MIVAVYVAGVIAMLFNALHASVSHDEGTIRVLAITGWVFALWFFLVVVL